jgi:hypothetical protein
VRNAYSVDDCPYHSVYLPDHCRPAAKRQSGGLGGSVWRHGVADGFWSPRFRDTALEGHYAIGSPLHGDVAVPFHFGDAHIRREQNGSGFVGSQAYDPGQIRGSTGEAGEPSESGGSPFSNDYPSGWGSEQDRTVAASTSRASAESAGEPGRAEEIVLHAEVAELADALA